jgi:hypothetical protein
MDVSDQVHVPAVLPVACKHNGMHWIGNEMFEMFIDHSVDPYMGRSPIGCRARQNT